MPFLQQRAKTPHSVSSGSRARPRGQRRAKTDTRCYATRPTTHSVSCLFSVIQNVLYLTWVPVHSSDFFFFPKNKNDNKEKKIYIYRKQKLRLRCYKKETRSILSTTSTDPRFHGISELNRPDLRCVQDRCNIHHLSPLRQSLW